MGANCLVWSRIAEAHLEAIRLELVHPPLQVRLKVLLHNQRGAPVVAKERQLLVAPQPTDEDRLQ
jgi:hypothetical protein